jgi:hypothetical protein
MATSCHGQHTIELETYSVFHSNDYVYFLDGSPNSPGYFFFYPQISMKLKKNAYRIDAG